MIDGFSIRSINYSTIVLKKVVLKLHQLHYSWHSMHMGSAHSIEITSQTHSETFKLLKSTFNIIVKLADLNILLLSTVSLKISTESSLFGRLQCGQTVKVREERSTFTSTHIFVFYLWIDGIFVCLVPLSVARKSIRKPLMALLPCHNRRLTHTRTPLSIFFVSRVINFISYHFIFFL